MRIWKLALALLTACLLASAAHSQERSLSSVAHGATAQERLLMEQIDQLAGAGQITEALANLKRLIDQSQGRLIEHGAVQRAATLSVQLHRPIVDWGRWRLDRWSQAYPDKLHAVMRTDEELARGLLNALDNGPKISSLQEILKRYSLATAGTEAKLILCDLYLDRGWNIAAGQTLHGPGTELRTLGLGPSNEAIDGVPWIHAWPRVRHSDRLDELLDRSLSSIDAPTLKSADELRIELLKRIVTLTLGGTSTGEAETAIEWAQALSRRLRDEPRSTLENWLNRTTVELEHKANRIVEANQPAKTFSSNYARSGSSGPIETNTLDLSSWPTWSKPLERITGRVDRNPASKPPVAEANLATLPYYPLVHDGKVFVHELTRITAMDAKTGKSWPPTEPAMPLYDSGVAIASYFPFGYSLLGTPRGTLTIEKDRLYARVGPPVTGWSGRAPTNELMSLSSIISLDLKRQGSMTPGFPVRLAGDEFPNAEFDGTPVVIGQHVLACVLTRDNVNMRRWVISLDKDTGSILWRSPILASGMVSGSEQASLVSHQLLAVSGGRVFVNTNLGAIACLDLENGQIVWLVRYQRSVAAAEEPYPRPDRYRYRDLTPCMVIGSQVICAPQDCPELFSVDAISGQLLWSTDAEAVDDANQMLGVHKESLIVSGDRIYWLDSGSGKILAAFPSGGVGEVSTALPAPRGFGRGIVVGDRVLWPTQNEIFVFGADPLADQRGITPKILQRIPLETRGAESGNLTRSGKGLVIAGPGRMFVFE